MTKLSVANLFLDFGSHEILKDVSVQLERGEVLVLLGPSGSGKTTLLRAIAGLELPKRGTIRIDDQVMFDATTKLEVPAEQRNLGFVFQSYGLWPHCTVFDNVAYGLRLRKLPGAEVERRIRPAELARLPWEFLFDPGRQDYLGLSLPLVRYPQVLAARQPLQVAPPLRVLGMVARPGDRDALDVDDEQRRLRVGWPPPTNNRCSNSVGGCSTP